MSHSPTSIPSTAIIAESKLRAYLLAPREHGDKSKFLARAGFLGSNWRQLESAIRSVSTSGSAVLDATNEYGDFYRQDGILVGPNGVTLPISLIWLKRKIDGEFHFITLKPLREK